MIIRVSPSFGETQKRSSFMVRLQEDYKFSELSSGAELAGYLSSLMQFLGITADAEFMVPASRRAL